MLNYKEADWQAVTVKDQPMLFSCCRVDHKTIPEGLHVYDVRHDDECQGDPVQICTWVMVNHWGTLLSKTELPLEPNINNSNAYLDIDPEEDWNYEGFETTIEEYMSMSGGWEDEFGN